MALTPCLRALALSSVLAALGLAGPAEATQILRDRPPADPFSAGTLFSDEQQPRESAGFFALGTDAELTALVWWGGYFTFGDPPSPETSPFEIRLYADTGAGPELTPFASAAVTATVTPFPSALPEFEFAATLAAPIALAAGVTYWLAIVDVDPANPTFAWRKHSEAFWTWSRATSADAWEQTPGLGSFRLEGTVVPEPGTAALAALGLAGLAAARGRRAR